MDGLQTPELAAQVTLLPIEALRTDAAIIFSDILVIPEAMGFPYSIEEGKGPYFTKYIQTPEDVSQLRPVVPEKHLGYVLEALTLSRRALPAHISLIGFSGAPWTLLAYLLEGGGSRTYARARRFLYQHPKAAHEALGRITDAVILYLIAQGKSGADCLQLFDTLAEHLPPSLYAEFGIPYLERIGKALFGPSSPPLLLFSKGTGAMLEQLAELPYAGLSVDWMTPMAEARRIAGKRKKVLQGNFDPALLYAPNSRIVEEVHKLLQNMEGYSYIANLGHGLYPDIPEEKVRFWVEAVQAYPEKPANF